MARCRNFKRFLNSYEILINNNYIRKNVISCTQNDLIWIRQIGREQDVYIGFAAKLDEMTRGGARTM